MFSKIKEKLAELEKEVAEAVLWAEKNLKDKTGQEKRDARTPMPEVHH